MLLSAAIPTPAPPPHLPFSPTAATSVTTTPLSAASNVVNAPAMLPVLALPANAIAIVGAPSTYHVAAAGFPTPTLSLVTFPAGMTISASTGLITWTPTLAQVGMADVTVKASNSAGAVTGTIAIAVSSPAPATTTAATLPVLALPADATAIVGAQSTYGATATGFPAPTFALVTFPRGMTISPSTGLITWTPTLAQVGSADVTVKASNAAGAVTGTMEIAVPSPAPVITTAALPTATVGGLYSAPITATAATAPGTPAPTFALLSGPTGLALSAAGIITWTPTTAQLGAQTVSVQATNFAGSATQTFSLAVTLDTAPPTVPFLSLGPITSTTALPLTWTAATDNVGVAGYRLYQWFPAVYKGHSGRGGGYTLVSPAKYVLLADNLTSASYTVTGLTPNTGYNFAVAAFDAAGHQSAYSNIVTGATLLTPSFTWSTTGSNVDPPLSVVANHALWVLVFPSGSPFPTLSVTNLPAGATFIPGNYTNSQLTYQSPTINWTPTASEVGVSYFTITVTNLVGTVTQQIPVTVTADVPVPSISLNGGITYTRGNMGTSGPNAYTLAATETFDHTGTSPQYALTGVPFALQLSATTNTPGTTYSLASGPAGMTIDPVTGAGAWTPAANQTSPTSFAAALTNSAGTTDLTVNFPTYSAAAPTGLTTSYYTSTPATATTSVAMNPTFSWAPPADPSAIVGYQVTVTAALTGVATVFDTHGPATSLTVPGLNNSQYFVSVASYDQYGNPGLSSAAESFYMAALPSIGWTYSAPAAAVGSPFTIQFHNFNAQPVSYALSSAPAGMTLDPVTGLLQWTPIALDLGNATLVVAGINTNGWGTIYMTLQVAVA